MAPTLDELSHKVRTFYSHIDPSKSQAEMDEITFAAYQSGEASINAQLMNKYGKDLNTFSSSLATSTKGVPPQQLQVPQLYPSGQQAAYQQQYYQQQQQPRVIYVQQPATPFSSQQAPGGYYSQNDPYHQGYNNGRRNAKCRLCNTTTIPNAVEHGVKCVGARGIKLAGNLVEDGIILGLSRLENIEVQPHLNEMILWEKKDQNNDTDHRGDIKTYHNSQIKIIDITFSSQKLKTTEDLENDKVKFYDKKFNYPKDGFIPFAVYQTGEWGNKMKKYFREIINDEKIKRGTDEVPEFRWSKQVISIAVCMANYQYLHFCRYGTPYLRRTCTAITKKSNEIQAEQNRHVIQSGNTPLKIGDKNVQIVKMKGDGHCGFRALIKALNKDIGKNKESKEITKLRKRTSELLKQNQKNIFGEITLEQLINLEYFKPNITICQNFDKYCEGIENNGYIGAIEILLLSKELKKEIVTFQIKDNTLTRLWGTYDTDEEIHSNDEKIMLLFNGSNHYDLLLERDENFFL